MPITNLVRHSLNLLVFLRSTVSQGLIIYIYILSITLLWILNSQYFNELTSKIFLLLHILHQLWVHVTDHIKKGLNRGVNSNATTSLRVTAHTVHEDLYTTVQSMQKLLRVFLGLPILYYL